MADRQARMERRGTAVTVRARSAREKEQLMHKINLDPVLVQHGRTKEGQRVNIKGQPYLFTLVETRQGASGKIRARVHYLTKCAVCGVELEAFHPLPDKPARFYPTRRCRKHKRKGVRVPDIFG